ncbi:MAG: response regulator [Rhodospirillaceae bacterium]|jgi:PleD family two-component response regulator|nr:response regulator [Rhodospirillaceae bacterium]
MMENDILRVLVVDEAAIVPRVIENYLQQLNLPAEVSKSNDPDTAWDSLKTGAFDIVFLDAVSEKVRGVELLARLRENESGSGQEAHVVMMTGKGKEAVEASMREGCDDMVVKPFAIETFEAKMDRFTAKKREKDLKTLKSGDVW